MVAAIDVDTIASACQQDLPRRKPINSHALFPWEGTFERWSHGWVHKNYWRIRHICPSHEDAMQIVALLFVECIHRYGDRIDNPRWLMSLFSRMVINHWNRLAVIDKRQRELVSDVMLDDVPEQVTHQMTSLIDILSSLPDELHHVLNILMEAPAEIIDLLIEGRNEESDNRAIKRWCGIKTDTNVLEDIRRILSGKMLRRIVSR